LHILLFYLLLPVACSVIYTTDIDSLLSNEDNDDNDDDSASWGSALSFGLTLSLVCHALYSRHTCASSAGLSLL